MQYNKEIPPTTRPHQPIVKVLRYIPIPPEVLIKILRSRPALGPKINCYRHCQYDSARMRIGREIAMQFTQYCCALDADQELYMSGHLLDSHPNTTTCGYGPTMENEASQ